MRRLIVLPFAFAFVAGCGGPVETALEQPATEQSALKNASGAEQYDWMHGAKSGGAHKGGGGSVNLVDHGGSVLPASTTYALWWGPAASFPSDEQTGIDDLLTGLNGSALLSVGNQYMRGGTTTTTFGGNLFDSSAPPARSPSTATIATEVCNALTAAGQQPSADAAYLVYTSNFPGGRVNYCAWHSYGTCNGTTIQVAYLPNSSGVAGCDPGNLYSCNTYSQGTRAVANVTSHELMETITDPDISAWYDNSGSEIGDKCAWKFSSCVGVSNGSWQLQEEWSNAVTGCVQQ